MTLVNVFATIKTTALKCTTRQGTTHYFRFLYRFVISNIYPTFCKGLCDSLTKQFLSTTYGTTAIFWFRTGQAFVSASMHYTRTSIESRMIRSVCIEHRWPLVCSFRPHDCMTANGDVFSNYIFFLKTYFVNLLKERNTTDVTFL